MTTPATVVIPTFNRARSLARTLDALARQDALDLFDVIVVDDGSQDDTASVLRVARPYRLTPLRQDNAGPGPARNRGIEAAHGRSIIFIDDDVIPAPDLVRRHIEIQERREAVVTGRLVTPPGRQPAWAEWECRTLEHQYRDMQAGLYAPTARQFFTANASVPREALLRAGLFDGSYRRAEDVELAYRLGDLGLTFIFEPGAVVEHDTPRSFGAWRAIALQYGQYDVRMWRAGRSHIAGNIAEEFRYDRNPATRALARATAGRGAAMRALDAAAALAIRGLSATGPRRAALSLCGAYFNTLYMHGACAALGRGRRGFWDLMQSELAAAERAEPAAVGG